MELRKRQDRIWMEDPSGVEIAFVSFPQEKENTVRIASTVVDSSLRGQGVAGILAGILGRGAAGHWPESNSSVFLCGKMVPGASGTAGFAGIVLSIGMSKQKRYHLRMVPLYLYGSFVMACC